MKTIKSKKGFTLIELLAVIVILAVLLMIAVPAITDTIERARKDTYISTAKAYINEVRYEAIQEEYTLPASGKYTVVATDLIKLERGSKKSPFGKDYDKTKCYVVIVNNGTAYNGTSEATEDYVYYVAMSDTQGNGFNLTEENSITRGDVKKGSGGKSNVALSSSTGVGASLSLAGKTYSLEKAYAAS